jgi:hypothetical protein
LADLHADLVLEELGVFEGGLIEDEDVGDGGDDEVDNGSAEPAGGGGFYPFSFSRWGPPRG